MLSHHACVSQALGKTVCTATCLIWNSQLWPTTHPGYHPVSYTHTLQHSDIQLFLFWHGPCWVKKGLCDFSPGPPVCSQSKNMQVVIGDLSCPVVSLFLPLSWRRLGQSCPWSWEGRGISLQKLDGGLKFSGVMRCCFPVCRDVTWEQSSSWGCCTARISCCPLWAWNLPKLYDLIKLMPPLSFATNQLLSVQWPSWWTGSSPVSWSEMAGLVKALT